MDKFHVIFNSDKTIKVCSSGDFDEVLAWIREKYPYKQWSEVIMREECYEAPSYRKHFILKVLEIKQSRIEKKWGVVPSFIKKFLWH